MSRGTFVLTGDEGVCNVAPDQEAALAKRNNLKAGEWESVFEHLQELVLANSGEDEFQELFKLLVAKLYTERFPSSFATFEAGRTASETSRTIDELLARAALRWPGIIEGRPASLLTPEHLLVCVEVLAPLTLLGTALEALDAAFEFLVSRAAKGAKGQYFTPRYVVDCCVKVVNPTPDERVIDPACGSGGFLIHAYNHVGTQFARTASPTYAENNLWGCDFDAKAIQVARALMLIAGDGHSNLYRVNSLLRSSARSLLDADPATRIEDIARTRLRGFKGFDVVLTNPPFAGEVREPHILQSYALSRANRRVERDVLFLERCVELLRPGGRIAIVLPHNKLGGARWQYVRDWLIANIRIVAVLGLGRNTFLPHTHQKAGIIFGVRRHKQSVAPNERVLFAISEEDGKNSRGEIISRPGLDASVPAWGRAQHDLGDFVGAFEAFAREEPDLDWPASS